MIQGQYIIANDPKYQTMYRSGHRWGVLKKESRLGKLLHLILKDKNLISFECIERDGHFALQFELNDKKEGRW